MSDSDHDQHELPTPVRRRRRRRQLQRGVARQPVHPPSDAELLFAGMLFGGVGCKVTAGDVSAPFKLGVVLGNALRATFLEQTTKGEVSAAAETGVSPPSSGAGT